MEHLSVKEVRAFVVMDALTQENLKMAERVNGHIRNCKECAEVVKAALAFYDKFSGFTPADGETLEKENRTEEKDRG